LHLREMKDARGGQIVLSKITVPTVACQCLTEKENCRIVTLYINIAAVPGRKCIIPLFYQTILSAKLLWSIQLGIHIPWP